MARSATGYTIPRHLSGGGVQSVNSIYGLVVVCVQ